MRLSHLRLALLLLTLAVLSLLAVGCLSFVSPDNVRLTEVAGSATRSALSPLASPAVTGTTQITQSAATRTTITTTVATTVTAVARPMTATVVTRPVTSTAFLAQLRSATYPSELIPGGMVTLTDGKFEKAAGTGATEKISVSLVEPAAFGDLNGDKKEDAVVILATNTGGSGVFYELYAVLSDAGKLKALSPVPLGDRVRVDAITIQDKAISLDLLIHRATDPLCCPSQGVTQNYTLDGELLVLGTIVERPTLRLGGTVVVTDTAPITATPALTRTTKPSLTPTVTRTVRPSITPTPTRTPRVSPTATPTRASVAGAPAMPAPTSAPAGALAATRVTRTITINAPVEGQAVRNGVEIKGSLLKTPADGMLTYYVYAAGSGKVLGSGDVRVIGEAGKPGTFSAPVIFTAGAEKVGRIDLAAIDPTTGLTIARAGVNVGFGAAIKPFAGKPRTISIIEPITMAQVTSPLRLRGATTITPFEKNLVYRIYFGTELLGSGPVTVKGELGAPGTFDADAKFTAPGSIVAAVQVLEVDAAAGIVVAEAWVDVIAR